MKTENRFFTVALGVLAFVFFLGEFVHGQIVETDRFPTTIGQLLIELPDRSGVNSDAPDLPPGHAVYRTESATGAKYDSGELLIVLECVGFRSLQVVSRELVDRDECILFDASLRAIAIVTSERLGLDGASFPVELKGSTKTVVRGKDGNTTGSWDTEIVSMDLRGSIPDFGEVILREHPDLPSSGRTAVRDDGGQFRIDSFFDIWTEVSVDGGDNFIPAGESSRVTAFESGVGTADASLPPRDGAFRTAGQKQVDFVGAAAEISLVDVRVQIDEVIDRRLEGEDEIAESRCTLQATALIGGGAVPVKLAGQVQTVIHGRGAAAEGSWDTEIISLSLSGNVGVAAGGSPIQIRESPELVSGGKTRIARAVDNEFIVDSFFDVWTEISFDGGETWNASTGASAIELRPDPQTTLISVAGETTIEVMFEGDNEGDAADDDQNGLDEVRTEIVSMDLNGRSPRGPVSVKLDRERQSFGEIEEQENNTAGRLDVAPFAEGVADSFFDVWTEISIGGQIFVPESALRMVSVIGHKPPIDGERYCSTAAAPQRLIDLATGAPSGMFLVKVTHDVAPTVEHDVFPKTTAELELELPPMPGLVRPLAVLPAAGSAYKSPAGSSTRFDFQGLSIVLREVCNRPLSDPPPVIRMAGEDEIAQFQTAVRAIVEINGTATGVDLSGSMQVVTRRRVGQTTGSWDTEIVSMDLTGASPGGPTIVIRESLEQPSSGQTSISDIGGGQFRIDSFFDVWTEVSVDGDTFTPAENSMRVQAFESGVGAVSADLPPDRGSFRTSSAETVAYRGGGLQAAVQKVRLSPRGEPQRSMLGDDEIAIFNALLQGLAVINGESIPFAINGQVATIVLDRAQRQAGTFDTEILSMDLTGNIGGYPVQMREPLGRPSQGKTEVTDLGDGTFRIDSFFDVWTEISFDGGASWVPAANASRVALVDEATTQTVQLCGPAEVDVYFEGPKEGDASDDDRDGRDEVSTEMVSLNLSGDSPFGPVEVGLNPDLRSLGGIAERQNPTPGTLDLPPFAAQGIADSFFDIAFQLTVNGQTLVPATGVTRLATTIAHKPPTDGEVYVFQPPAPVELLDAATGLGTGIFIVREIHTPAPTEKKTDIFEFTIGKIDLLLPDGSSERVVVAGPTTVQTSVGGDGSAEDSDGDGLDQVETEILSMDLRGNSSLGPVQVNAAAGQRSRGEIEERVNNTPGVLDIAPFSDAGVARADSFFDVFFDITVAGQRFHGASPIRIQSIISECPPAVGEAFMGSASQPIPLLTPGGAPTGISLTSAMHTPRPPKEVDQFPEALVKVQLRLPDGSTEIVRASGPTTVLVCIDDANGLAADTDADGRDQVPTEIISMDLSGNSASLGPIFMRLDPTRRSLGEIEEQDNNTAGVLDVPPFAATGKADSFFDVFFEIEVGGKVFTGADAIRLSSVITHKPPNPGEAFMNATAQDIELLDDAGQPTGITLVSVMHTPNPTAYELWAYRNGLNGRDADPDADPNGDELSNAGHHGLNTDPLSTDGRQRHGRLHFEIVGEGAASFGTLTLPVRDACVFVPGSKPIATAPQFRNAQIVYELRPYADLGNGQPLQMREIVPARSAGLPPLDPGWGYRTVQFLDSTRAVPRAFVGVKIMLITP